jgi:hypothetical protein
MTIEKKLDIVLDYFRRNKKDNSEEWQIVSEKVGLDLNELVMKLIKDEYIIKREDRPHISVTIAGLLFEGYVKQKFWTNVKRLALFMESLSLVIFSGIGAAWVIIEICDHCSKH